MGCKENPQGRALLIIDIFNPYNYPGGLELAPKALRVARSIARLRKQCAESNIPSIFANDNFGHWQSNLLKILDSCRKLHEVNREIVEILAPSPEDYFILKPRHSAFYLTPLELLLEGLGVKRLIICGLTTNHCVLFTVNDAYLRQYEIMVPENGVTSIKDSNHELALSYFRDSLSLSLFKIGEQSSLLPFSDNLH